MRDLRHIIGDRKLIHSYILETTKHIVKSSNNDQIFDVAAIKVPLGKIVDVICNDGEDSGIILLGMTGVGKTALMTASTRVFSAMYGKVERLNAQDMIKSISNEEGYFISGVHASEYLYIDDIGTEHEKYIEFGQIIKPLEQIIHERYNVRQKGGLFATTNLELKEISDRYGSRVFSRLAEMCTFIKMDGKDFRKS